MVQKGLIYFQIAYTAYAANITLSYTFEVYACDYFIAKFSDIKCKIYTLASQTVKEINQIKH